MKNLKLIWFAGVVTLGGCSTVMEANRPPSVNLHRFAAGERRFDVVADVGAPIASEKDGAKSCDIYKLYTQGVSDAGKGAIILTEAAADFFTVGLAEALTTPGEAMTKSKLHTVLFCYKDDGRLTSVTASRLAANAIPGEMDRASIDDAWAHPSDPTVAAALQTLAPTPPKGAKPDGGSSQQ
jgi:hypothetical protein